MVSIQEVADFISKSFLNCPLCKSKSGFTNSKVSFDDYVECKSCGARWHLLYKSKEMVLKRASNDLTGDFLLEVKRTVSFWQSLEPNVIDWDKTTKPSSDFLRDVYLEEGERVLVIWNGSKLTKTEGRYVSVGGSLVWRNGEYVSTGGNLILTDQRLLCFGKYKRLVDNVLLESITQVRQKHFPDYEGVDITDNRGSMYSYRLTRMIEYPSSKPFIERAMLDRKEKIKTLKMKERVHVILDFSFLKDYMEKGGLVLQTFKCPHCDAPVQLPSSGNQTQCKHCGNTIYAQDIFEKVKALIG